MRLIEFRRVAGPARIHIADRWLDGAEIAALEAAVAAYPAATRRRDATGESFEAEADSGPLAVLRRRIDAATGIENALGASLRYRCYLRGQAHPPHLDVYEIDGLRLVLTAMVWLQCPARGGETDFPRAGVRLAPVRGRLAVWENYRADGSPDAHALHAGLAVVAGRKVTLTAFVYSGTVQRPIFADDASPETAIAGVIHGRTP